MNKLLPYEIDWVKHRLRIYHMDYAEVYDEVYDHMLSAIEEKRRKGDTREILSLFQEVMDDDIGSHKGIAAMQENMVASVGGYLSGALKRHFIDYFKSRQAVWALLLFALIYLSSQVVGAQKAFFLISLGGVVFGPTIHLMIRSWKRLHRLGDKRKPSLVVSSMFQSSALIVPWVTFLLLSLPGFVSLFTENEVSKDMVLVFLGPFGLSVVLTLAVLYWQSFAKVLHTDYKKMMGN